MYNHTPATEVASPIRHTTTERAAKRARHFFHEGKDTFQTKSPSLKVAISEATLNNLRYKAALREQQASINSHDHAFIQDLFATDIPHDAFLNAVD